MNRLLIAASAAILMTACDGNNGNSEDPVIAPEVVAFDTFLLDMVDPNKPAIEAVSIEETVFAFPDDSSAFAGLFP